MERCRARALVHVRASRDVATQLTLLPSHHPLLNILITIFLLEIKYCKSINKQHTYEYIIIN